MKGDDSMENHYNCIYMYTNKINGKRYIGQTNDFNRRYKEHIAAMTNENDNEYIYPIQRAFRKYGLDNFEVKILKENLNTQCLLNFYECYYIKKFDLLCKNGKGYNLSDGGSNGNNFAGKTDEEMEEIRQKQSEAHKGKKHSEKSKQKISNAKKGENNPFYGKHHTEESRKKMRENHANNKGENNPNYGKHPSEETKQKLSKARKGKNNPKAKRVYQYDLNGNLIRVWDYIKQASEELGINKESISKCCRGKRKTAGGFIWRYAE